MVLTRSEKCTLRYILENVKDVMERNGEYSYKDNDSFILSLKNEEMDDLINILRRLDNE